MRVNYSTGSEFLERQGLGSSNKSVCATDYDRRFNLKEIIDAYKLQKKTLNITLYGKPVDVENALNIQSDLDDYPADVMLNICSSPDKAPDTVEIVLKYHVEDILRRRRQARQDVNWLAKIIAERNNDIQNAKYAEALATAIAARPILINRLGENEAQYTFYNANKWALKAAGINIKLLLTEIQNDKYNLSTGLKALRDNKKEGYTDITDSDYLTPAEKVVYDKAYNKMTADLEKHEQERKQGPLEKTRRGVSKIFNKFFPPKSQTAGKRRGHKPTVSRKKTKKTKKSKNTRRR